MVHVITRLIVGGAQENTVTTVLGLHARPGIEVELISGPTSGPEGSLESLLARHHCPPVILPSLVRPIHPWMDVAAWRALVNRFRRVRPHIVHTHSGKAGLLGRLAARRAGVPIIIHTIHGPSFGPFQGAAANRLFLAAERWAGRVTTQFVSVADAMTQQYLAAGIGRPDQYIRIYSGFELAPYLNAANDPDLRARLGIDANDLVVGKMARLFKLKGHDDLFAAAPELVRRFPRVKFLLVGDGIWRERFETAVRALGLAHRFVFAGLVPPEMVPRYVGIMDVLVHLSRREGLPRALPQAMAAGKPVVAFDCDGAREVCLEGETGFRLTAGDRDGLVARLSELLADPELRARLGARGRALAVQWFPAGRMVEQIHDLYRSLLRAREGHEPQGARPPGVMG